MPRDYKYRAQSRSRRRQTSPAAWFVAGMLLGAGMVALAWLKLGEVPVISASLGPKAVTRAEPEAKKAAEPPDPGEPPRAEVQPPRFEYYSVLPEMEVVIPPDEIKGGSRPPAPPVSAAAVDEAAPPRAEGVYLLQLGSFRRNEDADRLKASLGLLGISARIEKVTIDDKGTYFRVRSGPYSKEQVYSLHARLEENRVDSQIIRVKN